MHFFSDHRNFLPSRDDSSAIIPINHPTGLDRFDTSLGRFANGPSNRIVISASPPERVFAAATERLKMNNSLPTDRMIKQIETNQPKIMTFTDNRYTIFDSRTIQSTNFNYSNIFTIVTSQKNIRLYKRYKKLPYTMCNYKLNGSKKIKMNQRKEIIPDPPPDLNVSPVQSYKNPDEITGSNMMRRIHSATGNNQFVKIDLSNE
uniref:Uncharacterized protein n=1 Tax=Heterorhabditis bacteriophora TaxID=37862 RepID=A0A1I7WRG0_HETBA